VKKLFVLATIILIASFALAQSVTGNLNYIPTYDVMGAHENGGRGCAGCHAPHNGSQGSGGNVIANAGNNGIGAAGAQQGGLWGVDTGAILTSYATIMFNGGKSHHSGVLTLNGTNNWSDSNYTGVVTCLSCHDGNVSKGAMMAGVSYEQAFGLLNAVSASRNYAGSVTLYGANPIPTLLALSTGNGGTAGYGNQHPVGQTANLGAALGSVLTTANYGLSAAYTNASLNVAAIGANTPYGLFAATYYPGAVAAAVSPAGNVNPSNNYVVCTTCHNQHNMAVYGGGQRGEAVPTGVTQVRTIFFVNGGYNPGAPYDPTHEPSTMRFCQQCHFSFSSEYFGATNVGTAY